MVNNDNFYVEDKIKAIDAKFEAQKIAFSPLTFCAMKAMRDLGIIRCIEEAGDDGISDIEIANKCNLSLYGVGVLCDMGLGMGAIKLCNFETPKKFRLSKLGWMLQNDSLTIANMDFVADVCYKGAASLEESICSGKPEGLKVFSNLPTIYEALSTLPPKVRSSWFKFDHFYSDIAFDFCLPIVLGRKPNTIVDIGANTGKWALRLLEASQTVCVKLVDLPGQLSEAKDNIKTAGFLDRADFISCNVLNKDCVIPQGNAMWMSQFLDCFSLEQIKNILENIARVADTSTDIYVLEPFWDCQRFRASSYSLMATSLYFTCMANGVSKMYCYEDIIKVAQDVGLSLQEAHHNIGSNAYSLLRFCKIKK